MAADDPWVVWVASDGTNGVSRASELARDRGADNHQVGFQHCYGTSPLENSCTIVGTSTTTWLTGWNPPTLAPTGYLPQNGGYGFGGALVASTQLEMTGTTNAAKVLGRCNWSEAALFGNQFPGAAGGVYCLFERVPDPVTGERAPYGTLTANFHTGAYDPNLIPFIGPFLPSTADTEAGVGTWHAILYAI
ncbi:MAG TPA: hypothetical protein VGR28_05320 [Candidatus Thermoplasmatota archaeon]|nr:hypothetical protein [Candidatus Thermoplasmatota archaeon]